MYAIIENNTENLHKSDYVLGKAKEEQQAMKIRKTRCLLYK